SGNISENGHSNNNKRNNAIGKVLDLDANKKNTFVLAGLVPPFNKFNGIKLFFPEGSLSENITISVKIPEIAEVTPLNDILFTGDILSAVTFEVSVNGEVICPYYFNIPIEITIPFSGQCCYKLGLKPENLGLFYISSSDNLDAEGITDIAFDSDKNHITGKVIHFSDIAIAPQPVSVEVNEDSSPKAFGLSQNYPNPFNNTTCINYEMPESSHITITIYSLLGQKIKVLVDEIMPRGIHDVSWDGTDGNGLSVTSGMYIYQLRSINSVVAKKLILIQ
ncbi:T9SS type A sorting domain-containing protein, partial [Candidatus Latescibacterota bacterium]